MKHDTIGCIFCLSVCLFVGHEVKFMLITILPLSVFF